MALQGQSPPFATAASPPRMMNGHPDHPYHHHAYNPHRPMLPPSPQQFPRYQSQPPLHHAPLPGSLYDAKGPVPPPPHHHHQPPQPPLPQIPQIPQKRPGSSMSISSMLEAGPERSTHDISHLQNPHSQRAASVNAPAMSVTSIMSPPNQPARVGLHEYPYKRSQTPDRFDTAFIGNRHRSASGTSMAPARPYDDRYAQTQTPHFAPHSHFSVAPPRDRDREDHDASARRTSISSILQRPSSQPQVSAPLPPTTRAFDPLPPQRNNWYADPPPPASAPESHRPNGFLGSYDTKPPGVRDIPRTIPNTQAQPSPSLPNPSSLSPEARRSSATSSAYRTTFAGILNAPTSQPVDSTASHSMLRQDSSQSQSDRSIHGDPPRFRHFSPYGGPAGSQHHFGSRTDDQNRKGSDEAPHKTILGLGLEGRRGRYSPVPQAVQGAQAHTPVPDGGVKSEQGRVFSGIGGGIGSSTTPVPVSSSPFRREDATVSRAPESMKMARSSSGIGKRSRKQHEEDIDQDGGKKTNSAKTSKRTKYQNSYKADLEEMNTPTLPRRATPLANSTSRNAANNFSSATSGNGSARYDSAPVFKPRKTVKVATVVSQTLRKPRRHLGTFQYDADVVVPETYKTNDEGYELCIKPRLPDSFSDETDLNCTYTIHVSKNWLGDRERKLITSTRNVWGSGIYTDDTDPVAAAMHMGWIKPSFHNVDEALLQKVVHDQNSKVDIHRDLKPPSHAIEIPKGKDIKITCVVMPQLDKYEDTARFGLRSRSWPEGEERIPHDGVSFSILKVEVVDIGPLERKLGRTGKSKRAWLQAQMQQRERAVRLEKERVAKVVKQIQDRAHKRKEEEDRKVRDTNQHRPSPLCNEVFMDVDRSAPPAITSVPENDEWKRQLASAAA